MSDDQRIRTWMVFEVLAAQQEAAESSLNEHVDRLRSFEDVEVTDVEFDEVKEVDNPHPAIDTGYSQVCEVRCSVDGFANLIQIVLNYGPSMIEVEGPDEITLDLTDAQESLNLVAEMMHKFLQAGAGGMMISNEQEQ